MKFIREHIIFRFIWFVLALHILNFSVDTPDPQFDHVPEDLSYNDIESIAEIFLEQVLDLGNVIAEHDEHDNDNGKINLKTGIDFFIPKFTVKLADISYFLLSTPSQYKEKYYELFHPELNSPPPKA